MTLLELVSLLCLLLIALSIVWATLKTGISPMMSSAKACKAMLDFIDKGEKGPFIDLGSSWGIGYTNGI